MIKDFLELMAFWKKNKETLEKITLRSTTTMEERKSRWVAEARYIGVDPDEYVSGELKRRGYECR